jgi:hypothetical protein
VRFDPLAILRTLVRHEVRFVMIGGVAGAVHGSPSVTMDLDICYDRRLDNLERLVSALRALKARLRGVDEDSDVPFVLDAATIRAGDHITFVTRHGDFDCLGTPAGTGGYDDIVRGAQQVDLDGLVVAVASLDDLIHMKRATGRAKDRAEVEILGALRDEIDRSR